MKKFLIYIQNNKAIKVISMILKTIAYIILLAILLVIVVQKVTKNNMTVGGYRIFTIVTGSMVPEYNVGDILVSKEVDPGTLKVGDDISYRGEVGDFSGKIITHRIITAFHDDKGYHFVTKGIANEIEDPGIMGDQVYGKVVYKTIFLSTICKLMNNVVSYFVIFAIVSIMVSYQVVQMIYSRDKGDDIDEGEKEK
ncbi:MAG TPA: signal peptidase I [Bacilli bacterium]|jgi:signal peptidase|nr:signal peptidase I [Bacilli bacterium]